MNKIFPAIRLLMTAFILLMPALPMCAQETTDSVFSFRFYTGKNEFYAPGMNNGTELARLFDCVTRYKEMIMRHEVYVKVDGYCDSKGTRAENLAVAKIRSNRVKSELITRKGLTENCFSTRNHSGEGDFVLVSIAVPKEKVIASQPPQEPTVDLEKKEVKTEKAADIIEETVKPDPDVKEQASLEPEVTEPLPEAPLSESAAKWKTVENFALKTNLLDYAILMPNVEIEWMFAPRWSAALEIQGAWYAKEDPHKVYRVSTVIPEVRHWVIDRSRWHGMYVGIFGGAGSYDLSDGKKGHKGEGFMAGVSAGYMWPISKHLSLEAGVGVGYLRARDKEYVPRDGHFLYQLTKNINYFGPLRLKLSLVWRLQHKIKSLE